MGELRIYNTLSRAKEPFAPAEGNTVRMYTCGPTVYDVIHIGNLRTFLLFDTMRRYFRYKGFGLQHVMNITDVDDKTIAGAQREGVELAEYTERYVPVFLRDMDLVRIEQPEVMPRATEHVKEMQEIVATLLERGLAYQAGDSIYYRVSAFKDYGKLSRRQPEEVAGATLARVDADEYKDDVTDFALWKGAKEGEPAWDSPWGPGRPGWHLECSAMAMKYLGETIDLHAGGTDLIFPHHENEIAQSEGATGVPFARTWVHAGYVTADGQKMSKSLGNFYTLGDLVEQGLDPAAIRLALTARAHYRSQLDIRREHFDEAAHSLERLRDFADRIEERLAATATDPKPDPQQRDWLLGELDKARQGFEAAMDDDLNLPGALGHVFTMMRPVNAAMAEGWASRELLGKAADLLKRFDTVLAVIEHEKGALDEEIEALIQERERARADRDYARADEIRAQLAGQGIVLEDTPSGVRWRRAQA
ncbi:MAG: cysteine--tRNA ligase [Armatimonadota bacterium]